MFNTQVGDDELHAEIAQRLEALCPSRLNRIARFVVIAFAGAVALFAGAVALWVLTLLTPVGVRILQWSMSKNAAYPAAAQASNAVDPVMAQAGEVLFKHAWTPGDPLAAGGDGLGPVFNDRSCVACHRTGGVGGSGDLEHNVQLFTLHGADTNGRPREGVIHKGATDPAFLEATELVLTGVPAAVSAGRVPARRRGVFSQRNTPALFGAGLIDAIPDSAIFGQELSERHRGTPGRTARLAGKRVGKFGWKAQTASLGDFVQAACANELGLGNPGQAQPRPLGRPDYQPPGLDLTLEQCNQLTAFVASLPRPVECPPADFWGWNEAKTGKELFMSIGCADCHTPSLGSVDGLYSDLLLHHMGQELVGGGSYNQPQPQLPSGDDPESDEWRTPPLWGVADSAPYLHDGRARTLSEAIEKHGGQTHVVYSGLVEKQRKALIAFLQTLHATESY
jgi:CxxC motif-containing protein (DUF1111 family)